MIELNKTLFVAIYITIGFLILYKILFKKDSQQSDYEKLYNEILTSSKYKVKGQNDTEEQ